MFGRKKQKASFPKRFGPETPGPKILDGNWFQVQQNTSGPFKKRAVIKFGLAQPCQVKLVVLNQKKEVVAVLHNGSLPAGTHKMVWDMTTVDGRRLPSGSYLYQLQADGYVAIRTITFRK